MVFSICKCKFMVFGFHHYARSLFKYLFCSCDVSIFPIHICMLVSSGHIPISCKNTDRKINIKSGIDKLSTISTDNNFSIICNILNICTLSCSVNSFIYLIMAFDFKTAYSPTLKIKAGVLLSPFFLHFSSSNFHIYNCSICNSKSLLLFSLVILITYCMLTAKMTFFYTKNDIYILRGIFFCKSHAKYLLKYKLLSFKHNFKYS